jgi:hypothetical protein
MIITIKNENEETNKGVKEVFWSQQRASLYDKLVEKK